MSKYLPMVTVAHPLITPDAPALYLRFGLAPASLEPPQWEYILKFCGVKIIYTSNLSFTVRVCVISRLTRLLVFWLNGAVSGAPACSILEVPSRLTRLRGVRALW